MFYTEIKEQTGPGSAFLEHLEAQILKIFLFSANHAGAFVGSIYVHVCPKKLWIHHWYYYKDFIGAFQELCINEMHINIAGRESCQKFLQGTLSKC